MGLVSVCETFTSIQGESSYSGLPCHFIRVSGCNLRCSYCDTRYAYPPGRDVPVEELVAECAGIAVPIVEVTGGEPLLQPAFPELAAALRDRSGKRVLVETNGSLDISRVPDGVVTIMDVKCPGSGESEAMDPGNVERLRPEDEVKFVLADRSDYDWATQFVERHGLAERCAAILFGPVHGVLDAGTLSQWILEDGPPVRLQLQLHRLLGRK
jgi:7-carboxy-7-deazaguanine synthase